MNKPTFICQAEFDPRVKTYLLLSQLVFLTTTIVGILFIPFWAIAGIWWNEKYYQNLECTLTTRSLIVRHGVWVHVETIIPLDKIQDFSTRTSPLLSAFGLCTLQIETAAQKTEAKIEADLPGIFNARAFRDKVLLQREIAIAPPLPTNSPVASTTPKSAASSETPIEVLRDIRDTLGRIESSLSSNKSH